MRVPPENSEQLNEMQNPEFVVPLRTADETLESCIRRINRTAEIVDGR